MTNKPFPEEPDHIACHICLEDLPDPASKGQEVEQYVQHFCGIECYSLWKQKPEEVETSESEIV